MAVETLAFNLILGSTQSLPRHDTHTVLPPQGNAFQEHAKLPIDAVLILSEPYFGAGFRRFSRMN